MKIEVGTRVEAKCDGWKQYYAGVVTTVNDWGESFDIRFDDGEYVCDLPADRVRPDTRAANAVDGAADAADGDPDEGAEEGRGQLLNLGWEGRREEQRLA